MGLPMIDSPRLLADLRKLLARLEDDLRDRADHDAATAGHLKACLLYTSPSPRD